MSQVKFKDKSWGIVFILFFIAPPLGFIALVIKIIYSIYKSQESADTATDLRRVTKTGNQRRADNVSYTKALDDLEEDLVDVFHHGRDGEAVVESSLNKDEDMSVVATNADLLTEYLEPDLTISTEALRVEDVVEVTTEIDLTFEDVQIDTEITIDHGSENHNYEGEVPLKVVTCRMCETENRLYKIDKFETPTCEKCGMLLLD